MTVRIHQIERPDTRNPLGDTSYLPDPVDGVRLPVGRSDILGIVREIMRQRSDCTRIPRVVGAYYTETPNQYGDSMFIDVNYSRGYRATYGVQFDAFTGDRGRIQCYMD